MTVRVVHVVALVQTLTEMLALVEMVEEGERVPEGDLELVPQLLVVRDGLVVTEEDIVVEGHGEALREETRDVVPPTRLTLVVLVTVTEGEMVELTEGESEPDVDRDAERDETSERVGEMLPEGVAELHTLKLFVTHKVVECDVDGHALLDSVAHADKEPLCDEEAHGEREEDREPDVEGTRLTVALARDTVKDGLAELQRDGESELVGDPVPLRAREKEGDALIHPLNDVLTLSVREVLVEMESLVEPLGERVGLLHLDARGESVPDGDAQEEPDPNLFECDGLSVELRDKDVVREVRAEAEFDTLCVSEGVCVRERLGELLPLLLRELTSDADATLAVTEREVEGDMDVERVTRLEALVVEETEMEGVPKRLGEALRL